MTPILRAACLAALAAQAAGPGMAAELKTLPVAGAALSYAEEGAGPPVLFLHGALSDLRVWDRYAAPVAAQARFVAYTQRYFGTAAWPDDGAAFSRGTHVADLIAVAGALDAGPVDLVAWSYGGEIATYAALERPDLFRSLVLYEPSVEALLQGLPGAETALAEFSAGLGPAIAALGTGDTEAAALRFIETVFRLPEGAAAEEPAPFPDYWRENGRTLPVFAAMAPGAPVSCGDLGALEVPVMVVLGTQTYPHFAMMAERLAQCAGNGLLVRMEGVGHDGPYRRPERFAALALGFRALLPERRNHDD
ncbi:alpha/beta fold hydrolase [Poseidonocella sp. HB161398]|uniref:alpha/beta fold hydrolase n=1 Tax=Poseidonocella sp. HB161398 TaxID=2320855 RepID=UPI001107AF31|nr:alpha/beta hydrolase [Poseidonocella sp. HB161398]